MSKPPDKPAALAKLFRRHAAELRGYPTQADARRIAERIAQSLGVKPVVLVR